MRYFDSLPKIIKTDANRNSVIMTNLMARCSIIPAFLQNPTIYYSYDIQDGDTPETIAYKYYGDSYRYWIILFTNQIVDPQWDWPLDSNEFASYIADKYKDFNPYAHIHHYEKIITKYDISTQTTTIQTITIDETSYNSLNSSSTTYSLPTGSVSYNVSKSAVNYYDYENTLNESKRNIKILNSSYVDEVEKQFKTLMA
jgi:hypothetical protein